MVPGYDASTYGGRMAEVYDGWFAVPSDTEDTVAFLSGRIALLLAQRGYEVHGMWTLPKPE